MTSVFPMVGMGRRRAVTALRGRRVLVMGLGQFGGGVGVARFLAQQGAVVTVTDVAAADQLAASVEQLRDLPITFRLGGHELADFTQAELVVINPAVDRTTSEYVRAAVAAGVAITTEMNLFLERNAGFTIGVTGSVGKSTTTMLVYLAVCAGVACAGVEGSRGRGVEGVGSRVQGLGSRVEENASSQEGWRLADGPAVYLGGNIGKSLLGEVERIRAEDIVVLELSSFMLEETAGIGFSPNVAVVTNLFANHLDRHGTLENLAAVKQNILRFQRDTDAAVLNADHPLVAAWRGMANGRVVTYSTRGQEPLPLVMPGEHNQANARAALAAVEALAGAYRGHTGRVIALDMGAARAAVMGFGGLEHRLQCVHTSGGKSGGQKGEGRGVKGDDAWAGRPCHVRWYNDSKATTPEAAMTALGAFGAGEAVVIVGGYDKHADMSQFEEMLARRAGGVLGIGQTGAALVEHVRALEPAAGERVAYVETLERAVAEARRWLAETPAAKAVLLSPGCASWG